MSAVRKHMTVVTKKEASGTTEPVVTRIENVGTIGGSIGYVRRRPRKLKGGRVKKVAKFDFENDCILRDRNRRIVYFPVEDDREPIAAASFDLIKGVRVDGKVKTKFLITIGSQRAANDDEHLIVLFWIRALHRLEHHGLDPQQRQRIALDMVRKGARLPTPANLRDIPAEWAALEEVDEILSIIAATS